VAGEDYQGQRTQVELIAEYRGRIDDGAGLQTVDECKAINDSATVSDRHRNQESLHQGWEQLHASFPVGWQLPASVNLFPYDRSCEVSRGVICADHAQIVRFEIAALVVTVMCTFIGKFMLPVPIPVVEILMPVLAPGVPTEDKPPEHEAGQQPHEGPPLLAVTHGTIAEKVAARDSQESYLALASRKLALAVIRPVGEARCETGIMAHPLSLLQKWHANQTTVIVSGTHRAKVVFVNDCKAVLRTISASPQTKGIDFREVRLSIPDGVKGIEVTWPSNQNTLIREE